MYRFAFRGRYLVGQFVVLALAVLFIRLGIWQLDRLHQERQREATIRTRMAAAPAALSDVLGPGVDPSSVAFRRVLAQGRYDPSRQVLVRFRELNDTSGDDVATPLVLPDGRAVLVVRGWVAAGVASGTTQAPVVTPSGQVVVTGLVLPAEGSGGAGPTTRGGRIVETSRISVALLQPQMPYRLLSGYVQLSSQVPAPGPGQPQALPPPDFTQAPPHLSYAVQWFLFTVVGLVGWPLLIRKAAQERQQEEEEARAALEPVSSSEPRL